jgi:hypothetical protein
MIDIGFPYYFFGSPDSTDTDVMIDHPDALSQETDSKIVKALKAQYPAIEKWNINIVRIQDGIVVSSIPNKGAADSANNSLYYTFKYHDQIFDFPLVSSVNRNLPLATVKCVNACLLWCKGNNRDEEYRDRLRPILRSGNWFDCVNLLPTLTFETPFTNNNAENRNIYKSLAFNIGQTIALFNSKEIYTKGGMGEYHPTLIPLLKRETCNPHEALHEKLIKLHELINAQTIIERDKHEIEWNGFKIDTKRGRLSEGSSLIKN